MRRELGRPWGLPLRSEVASDARFEDVSFGICYFSHVFVYFTHCSNLKGT